MAERNTALSESVASLKEELRTVDGRRAQLESELRAMTSELSDVKAKLTQAQVALQIASKVSPLVTSHLYVHSLLNLRKVFNTYANSPQGQSE